MKNKWYERYCFLFWLFLLGSFVGFIHENLLTLIKGRYVLRQGLLYEPLIPIYGFGVVALYIIVDKFKFHAQNKFLKLLSVLIVFSVVGGVVEYLFSYAQEKIFGTVSWNYSNLKYNFNSRTSVVHSIAWGVLGVLFYQYLYPLFLKLKPFFNQHKMKIATIILSMILITDCSISFAACLRQTSRRNGKSADTRIERFLDTYYPDEKINAIYSNAKVVKK